MLLWTPGVDAPKNALQWSKNIFRTRAAAGRKLSLARKILAVLEMDLAPNKAAFGERSAGATAERQMLFSAGENGVDLRIMETEKGFVVRGQILGEGFAGATVRLGEHEAKTGELGEFSFGNVLRGKYDLTLRSGDAEITIEKLEIK